MDLAQLREFTVAYYGTGTAFTIGEPILSSGERGALQLLRELVNGVDGNQALEQLLEVDDILERVEPKLAKLLRFCFAADLSSTDGRAKLIERALAVKDEDTWLVQIIEKYNSKYEGINEIAGILLDLLEKVSSFYTTVSGQQNDEFQTSIRSFPNLDTLTQSCLRINFKWWILYYYLTNLPQRNWPW